MDSKLYCRTQKETWKSTTRLEREIVTSEQSKYPVPTNLISFCKKSAWTKLFSHDDFKPIHFFSAASCKLLCSFSTCKIMQYINYANSAFLDKFSVTFLFYDRKTIIRVSYFFQLSPKNTMRNLMDLIKFKHFVTPSIDFKEVSMLKWDGKIKKNR